MNVDKTWHDKEIPPVDDFRAVCLQIIADRGDGLAEGDVCIFEVNVLIVLLVPHDDATGTANDLAYCIRSRHHCSVYRTKFLLWIRVAVNIELVKPVFVERPLNQAASEMLRRTVDNPKQTCRFLDKNIILYAEQVT
ncbi:hypothetical protein [Sinorhizobium medicae]